MFRIQTTDGFAHRYLGHLIQFYLASELNEIRNLIFSYITL